MSLQTKEMPKANPGTRVGAIMDMGEHGVRFFGYGVYEGNFELPENVGQNIGIPSVKEFLSFIKEENPDWIKGLSDSDLEKQIQLLRSNPRIRLDNGKTVWGCECWWGPEEAVKEKISGCNIINVDIEEERLNYEEEKP